KTHFAAAMAEKPPALVVRFVHGDAVDPGLEAALAPEMTDVAEDLEEHFLDNVAGVAGLVQQQESEVINRLLEAREQRLIGRFFAGAQTADQVFILTV